MDDILPELDPRRLAEDLRQTWQGRMLMRCIDGREGAFVLSILAHSFDDVMPTLMRAAFPGFESIRPPFICSAAKVNKWGHVVADIVMRDNEPPRKNQIIFLSIDDLQGSCRRLADRLKLTDQERLEFFTTAKRWVVADQRLDPTMDARDPDSRHLTVH